ncbi:hypothetical protein NPIL_521231 [Nephila pilipes]|uniref:Uncharacterized protein n=1 Tax=Nephila pilipes TaxID=299642 RepID=A0A8X6TIH9_NEPPI|nr:hypothetical protein NPIL_521231 [Nephila pilipes]
MVKEKNEEEDETTRKIRAPRLPSYGYLRREISYGPNRKESTQIIEITLIKLLGDLISIEKSLKVDFFNFDGKMAKPSVIDHQFIGNTL